MTEDNADLDAELFHNRSAHIMIRSLTMLNEAGDTTISWSEDLDDRMEEIIQKKMDQGRERTCTK